MAAGGGELGAGKETAERQPRATSITFNFKRERESWKSTGAALWQRDGERRLRGPGSAAQHLRAPRGPRGDPGRDMGCRHGPAGQENPLGGFQGQERTWVWGLRCRVQDPGQLVLPRPQARLGSQLQARRTLLSGACAPLQPAPGPRQRPLAPLANRRRGSGRGPLPRSRGLPSDTALSLSLLALPFSKSSCSRVLGTGC